MLLEIILLCAITLGQCQVDVDGCAACDVGQTACTKCKPDADDGKQYLKDGSCVTVDACRQAAGYYPDDTTNPQDKKCMACDPTCATCSGAGADKCTKCKPDADDGKQYLKDGSCVTVDACRQAAGYYPDDTTNPQDKKCMACDPTCATCSGAGADKCTKCKPDADDGKQYLKKSDASLEGTCVSKEKCLENNDHYVIDSPDKECKACGKSEKPNTAGTQCFACTDSNCRRCNEANKCAVCTTGEPQSDGSCPAATPGCHSSCKECVNGASTNEDDKCLSCSGDNYLKVVDTATHSGVCVSAAACTSDGSHFTKEVADSNGSKKMCLPCNDATHGITDCKKCTLKTLTEGAEPIVVCSECTNKWLSPLGDTCLEKCPAGTYSERGTDNVGVCAPCHNTCAECDGNAEATSCRACYPGFVLSKGDADSTGTCIPECTGKYAENCEANQCTAAVGGSKYCSKCRTGYVPVDGICVSIASRAVIGCTPGNGVCTACTDSYFLQSGGCYRSTAFPGNKLCTTASQGKCTSCANGQQHTNVGTCPACPDGCSKCTAGDDPKECSECFPGYYRSGTKCMKCDASDGGIIGVPNCISCAPPISGSGPVTCYVKADGTSGGDDGTGGSTNKSGLSTGAIAGIAVAVVIVIGGLVGFLCWWFICRGKA